MILLFCFCGIIGYCSLPISIDFSVPLENGYSSDLPGYGLQIEYQSNKDTVNNREIHHYYFKGATRSIPCPLGRGAHTQFDFHGFRNHSILIMRAELWGMSSRSYSASFELGFNFDFEHLLDGYVTTSGNVCKELGKIDLELLVTTI